MNKMIALIVSMSMLCPIEILEPLVRADEPVQPDMAILEGIQVEADQVSLRLSEPAKYNTFIASQPPRLVLEIINARLGHAATRIAGQGKYMKDVRSGQFSGGASPVARVVIDLHRQVDYHVSASSNQLRVFLGASAKGSTAYAGQDSIAEAKVLDAPASTDKETTPEDAGSMSSENSSELMAMANHDSAIPGNSLAREIPSPSTPILISHRPRRDILSSLPRGHISLDFDNTDIGDILKLLAAKANINIIYGDDVNGSLTLHLSDVPFSQAFNLVLSMKRLVASQEGDNILRIMTPESLGKERTSAVGVTRVFPLNYLKAAEAKTTVDSVRTAEKRAGMTVSDIKNNNLIVTDTPEGLAATERLLSQIDVRPQQVLIEAKLVEVSLNKDLELGIQWDYMDLNRGTLNGKTGLNSIGSPLFPQTAPFVNNPVTRPFDQLTLNPPGTPPAGASGRGTGVLLPADKVFGAFTFGRITNNYMLSATLSAAAAQGKVKVLSDPKIATINGNQATINITTQIPYVTSSVTSNGLISQAVSYTTTGIQLTVTPTVNADGRITLKVTPNVSKPSAVAAAAGTTGAVAVDSRQADTNVVVRDGETIVIGGLITDSISNQEGKIPLLGDIPLLGWLFKKKTVIRQRVELLVFVTTRIIPD